MRVKYKNYKIIIKIILRGWYYLFRSVLIILIVFNCFRSVFSLLKLLTSLIFCHLFLHIYIFYRISAFVTILPVFTISIYLC